MELVCLPNAQRFADTPSPQLTVGACQISHCYTAQAAPVQINPAETDERCKGWQRCSSFGEGGQGVPGTGG